MKWLTNLWSNDDVVLLDSKPKISLVQEIHNTFYSSMEDILEACKIGKPIEDINSQLKDKLKNLKDLGFTNTQEVLDIEGKIKENQEKITYNAKLAQKKKDIEDLSQIYPHYKFIDKETLNKICNKYGLVYTHVKFFKGIVPDKNLKDLLNFKIKDEHRVYIRLEYASERDTSPYTSLTFTTRPTYIHERARYSTSSEERDNYTRNNDKNSMIIAALAKDFDLSSFNVREQKKFGQLIPKVKEDPIVLQPVCLKQSYYGEDIYYAIATAWGDEASDPLVINEKSN